jgi:hypothetical protein
MRRHALDPVSLVFGFTFTAAGVLFLAGQFDQAIRLRWLWPVLLLVLGLGILLDLGARREQASPDPAAAPADAQPTAAVAEPAEPVAADPEPVAAEAKPVAAEAEPVGAERAAADPAPAAPEEAPAAERPAGLGKEDPADRDR